MFMRREGRQLDAAAAQQDFCFVFGENSTSITFHRPRGRQPLEPRLRAYFPGDLPRDYPSISQHAEATAWQGTVHPANQSSSPLQYSTAWPRCSRRYIRTSPKSPSSNVSPNQVLPISFFAWVRVNFGRSISTVKQVSLTLLTIKEEVIIFFFHFLCLFFSLYYVACKRRLQSTCRRAFTSFFHQLCGVNFRLKRR
jgi:hypothetical protein